MTDIEKQALALVKAHGGQYGLALEAAIERHEAFKQEVSDELAKLGCWPSTVDLGRFIIAKPDPLVEAIKDCELATLEGIEEGVAHDLRAALAARGLEIREVGHD